MKLMKTLGIVTTFSAAALLAGCGPATRVDNRPTGQRTVYVDPATHQPGEMGIGIESYDVITMADEMVRDLLATPEISYRQIAPRIIVDAEYFINESSSRIDKRLITDRLRVALNRSAQGRMIFVARHREDMVEAERRRRRAGQTDAGTVGMTAALAGVDYRLAGRIGSLDSADAGSGQWTRFHQITFEMIDLESGELVWSNIYDFKKTGQPDVVNR